MQKEIPMKTATDLRYGHFWNEEQYARALDKPTVETYTTPRHLRQRGGKPPIFMGAIQDTDIISTEVIRGHQTN